NTSGAPVVTLSAADFDGDATGVRGQTRTFIVAATVPSNPVPPASVSYAINWGDGSVQTLTGPGSGTPVSHVFTDTGGYVVGVTATVNGVTSLASARTIDIKVVDYQSVRTNPTDASKTALALVVGGSTH